MKVTKQETLYHKDHGATLKHKCGKKNSSIVPFYFFLVFFYRAFLAFPPFFIWDNALLMMIITLLFIYNSILEQNMTLYECLRRCTGIGNESRVTYMKRLCMVALPQIQCQLHDHTRQYDNDEVCHNEWNGGKLAMYLGMAMEMP